MIRITTLPTWHYRYAQEIDPEEAERRWQEWHRSIKPPLPQNQWTPEQWEEYSKQLWQYNGSPFYEQAWRERMGEWGYDPRSSDLYTDSHKEFIKNPALRRVNPRHVQFIVNELVDRFMPIVDEYLRQTFDFTYEDEKLELPTDFHRHPTSILPGEYDFNAEIDRLVDALAEKSGITDQETNNQLAGFISSEVEALLSQKYQAKVKDEVFHVRVYGVSRAFGGAEEGGWWYDAHELVEDEPVKGLEAARQRREQLEEQWKKSGRDSFYEDLDRGYGGVRDLYDEANETATGMGDLDYGTRDVEGMDFPRGWTTSEYEKFEVTVELSNEPLKLRAPPHYE